MYNLILVNWHFFVFFPLCLFIGDQAKKLFLQSGLPASVLADIWWEKHRLTVDKMLCLRGSSWEPITVSFLMFCVLSPRSLADMNKDGKMDRLEFSVAMKLIKLKLTGTPLPSSLPIIMKQPPVRAPTMNNPTNPAYGTILLLHRTL